MGQLNLDPRMVVNFFDEPVRFTFNSEAYDLQPGEEKLWPINIAFAAEQDLGHMAVVAIKPDESREDARDRAFARRMAWLENRAVLAESTVRDHLGSNKPLHPRHDHRERVAKEIAHTEELMTQPEGGGEPKKGRKAA